ncbi:MAG: DUF5606 domain-containing protein [Flavobacteriales bacterium]|nr:DUF5606 domain-containing protein [Flavobacteriales bacterium]
MDLKEILSIAGKPGLYKLVTTSRTNIIVQGLTDGKRAAINGNSKISSLEDISIFTYEDDIPLEEVFQKIANHTKYGEAPSKKSETSVLRNFMEEVLPEYDEDRVYTSDLKKLFNWYNLLLNAGVIVEGEEEAETEAEVEGEEEGNKE